MAKVLILAIVLAVAAAAELPGRTVLGSGQEAPYRIHTLFSVECQNYFDWQTVGLVHSFKKARQPGPITRLLSCTDDELRSYRGMDLAPTMVVPSMSRHPKTGDWYPAINKPAGIVHWLKHSKDAEKVDWVVILDADMIIRGPIIPWELGAEKGRPVSAYYGYLVGCDNILSKLHTKHPELCDKVGGLLAMHMDDLRKLAPMWLSKTEEVREDRAHWATNITGDIYGKGWISEMYGYSFGAAEVGLKHKIDDNLMIYPGYTPRQGFEPILMHYGLPFKVGNWSFSKLDNHEDDIVYDCGRLFPEPPYPREPGNITRLLSCTDEDLKKYTGHDLAPTHYVPSMSRHPLTGDWYPAINKPAAVFHWLNHVNIDAEFIVILDADMILRGPITPWEFNAARGRPVSTPYEYLIGCDNVLAKLHTSHPDACDKVGGVIVMHIDDLRQFAMLWLHKTEEVRADKAHYATNITGDIFESGWISEMYGYSFGAAELQLRHLISSEILIYPGYIPEPGVKYRVFHYGLEFKVGNWSFDKANYRDSDVVNKCWAKFPDPPDPSTLDQTDENLLQRDLLSIECARTLNEALRLHHVRRNCPDPNSMEEAAISRKLGRYDRSYAAKSNPIPTSVSKESSKEATGDAKFSTFGLWMVALWIFLGLGFLTVASVLLSGRKAKKTKGKSYRSKRRLSHSGFMDEKY
ncbi:hypothetical protein EUGRSUZ_J02276 [Eucalyptus grandis]|uniref:Uncharacterized protein n=2 Tax=Eucalyptus grandis TaxID=71139 RepID=A0ACC3J9X3_EUCGR|nr:hypothetical protein EUGRSUZ_J02276 [Eucalyptus grandis]